MPTSGLCPHCGLPSEAQGPRYPDALCFACSGRATDLTGRAVALGNVSFSGGFVAHHRNDGTVCRQVTEDGRVRVDDAEFLAGEAHMGGCVVRPLRT